MINDIKELIERIKLGAYRYPSSYIMLKAIAEYHKFLALSWLMAFLNVKVGIPNFLLFILVPCIMLCHMAVRCDVYKALFYKAEHDYLIKHTLQQRQDINTQDYLLWVSFEAYKKYEEKHSEDNTAARIMIWSVILMSFFLFLAKIF